MPHLSSARNLRSPRPIGFVSGIGFSRAVSCPILTYAPIGRNCHERIQLLGSCAVPARDLTFRYLVARLNRLRKKSESRRIAASGAEALSDFARLTRR